MFEPADIPWLFFSIGLGGLIGFLLYGLDFYLITGRLVLL